MKQSIISFKTWVHNVQSEKTTNNRVCYMLDETVWEIFSQNHTIFNSKYQQLGEQGRWKTLWSYSHRTMVPGKGAHSSLFASFICTLLILILSPDPALTHFLILSFLVHFFCISVKQTYPSKACVDPSMKWAFENNNLNLVFFYMRYALAKYVVPGSFESACACLQSSCAGQWEGCEVGDRVKGKVKGKQVWDWSNSNSLFTQLYSSHGHRISSLTHVTDWAPTFLALAGVDLEGELDGVLTDWYSWLKLISIF